MKDVVYRNLRAHVQGLIDRDAPHAAVLIEVDWQREVENPITNESKVVCIARDDLDGTYTVWTVGFSGTIPNALDHGWYGLNLLAATSRMMGRLS